MIHLLKIEWLKQRHYILFKILIGAYLFFLPAILFIGKKIPDVPNSMVDPQLLLFHFPSVWKYLGYIGNWLVFFIFGFMAVLIITNEYSYRTLRQNIISGMERSEWFWSKVLFVIGVSLSASLYYALCAIVIGLAHGMDDTIYLSTVFKNSSYFFRYFLMCLGYMSFGMLVGVWVKRTGIALFAFIGYAFLLEPVLRGIHLYFIKNETMHYYPLNVIEDLCPIPFAEFADDFLRGNGFSPFLPTGITLVLATVYILLFGWLAYRRLAKSDL